MDVETALKALPKTPFFFLRHGETEWNKNRLAQGQTDVPLNQTGRDQADLARPLLKGQNIRRIIASPLERAFETATIINRDLNVPVERHSGLMEQAFGPYEGKPWTDAMYGGDLGNGAEPKDVFYQRIANTLVEALGRSGPVLLVGHGGWFRAMVELLCHLPSVRAQNAVPFRFDPPMPDRDRWLLCPVDPFIEM